MTSTSNYLQELLVARTTFHSVFSLVRIVSGDRKRLRVMPGELRHSSTAPRGFVMGASLCPEGLAWGRGCPAWSGPACQGRVAGPGVWMLTLGFPSVNHIISGISISPQSLLFCDYTSYVGGKGGLEILRRVTL